MTCGELESEFADELEEGLVLPLEAYELAERGSALGPLREPGIDGRLVNPVLLGGLGDGDSVFSDAPEDVGSHLRGDAMGFLGHGGHRLRVFDFCVQHKGVTPIFWQNVVWL